MKIKLSLKRSSGVLVDIVITADSTATVADVARTIAETDPMSSWSGVAGSAALTLAVAPPTDAALVQLPADLLIGEAKIGSGFIASVMPIDAHAPKRGAAAALLRVHAGPDAGSEYRLDSGHSTIGRDASADVVLTDPLVSKLHARIEIGSRFELVDLNSANGLLVDGGLVPRLRLIPGTLVTLGDTDISVIRMANSDDEVDPVLERGGGLMFNRSPRVEVRYPGTAYPQPTIPAEAQPRLFPWPMLVAPIMLGFTMYILTGRLLSLVMVAMTPMMMLGNVVGQRRNAGQKLTQEIDTFETQVEALEDELTMQVAVERERRHAESPPVALIYEQAMRLGSLLWTRRPEHWNFLGLRLGVGRALSRNTIALNENVQGIPKYQRQIDKLRTKFQYAEQVPILELLPSAGAIGIAGPREAVADVVRGLAVQLFGMHAPNEVIVASIVDPSWTPELEWLKWLPHTSSSRSPFAEGALADSQSAATALLNGLEEAVMIGGPAHASLRGPLKAEEASMQLGARVGELTATRSVITGDLTLVLFVSADAPVDRPRLTQVIERGSDAGIYTIFFGSTVESLPAACRTYVDVTQGLDNATVGYVRSGERIENVQIEGVSNAYAEVFAKRLAPVIDSSTVAADSSDIPRSVNLLSLVGTDLAEVPGSVVERWRQNNSILDRSGTPLPQLKRAGTLKAFVGQASPDAMTLDLRTQGPHALVGGTTGAGKSEFLQAWVLGMAAEYSPDRVTFLFVDYKGGSAFADCVELPHTVGLVTDLSPHLVRRALTSLRAELHFREHLFNRKKAKDLLELEKRRDPETPPALVLVIDEFAALAGEVPEFVDGVVDIAQRGRSLGIHLIMATQRPAGVIKDNLRANTNLRVALRMADQSDSKDVVGDPIAGTFDPSIPGRGIAKTGPGRLVSFQSAYAGGWTSDTPAKAEVKVAELRFGSLMAWESGGERESDTHDEDLGPTDQKRLVKSFISAASDAHIPIPRRPWLDDLPATVDIVSLPVGSDSKILLGKADVPERQLQEALYFYPDRDGAMLIYGTSGSGKSTALRSIAISAGMRPDLGAAEVYGLDFGSGSLRSLEALPHVGSIVSSDDPERIQRLMRMIGDALDERGKKFSAVNASSLSEYRRITGENESRILLLIDGFGPFRTEWEATSQRVPFYNVFMRILGEGRPLGIHAVATADRSGSVPTAVSANVSRRVILRLSEETAYQILGVAKDVLNDQSAPGRAIVEGVETQMAVLGGTTNVVEQSRLLELLANDLVKLGARPVPEVGSLPTHFSSATMPASIADQPVLGIAEDTLQARGFEPTGTFSVTGPPASGKTTAMRSLIASMLRFDPEVRLFHIAGRRAQLGDAANWVKSATTVEDVKALAKEITEVAVDETYQDRIMVVIENVPQFADTDAERALKELFQTINRSDHFLIGDADVAQLSSGFGFIGDFKAGRRGIALKPDSYDGDSVYKTAFPKVKRSDFPEGRGIFVQNGKIVTVQIPLEDGR
ncbi:MAG: FtsK/SpoIIIE domain-containing protein [Rhodoglobus sp.]|uniref:FtsK/SpoIIIE domain-containing protein n=1 Tax=Salinibacterium sp. G-O1 TaxID=3046208 RepID=UPI0024BB73CB|nr:FtsK/SpoIIIE domain-containing protein [Salinibacterium sp. G-O1]MDJ0335777.1 FtsK/SpoIIIE domain-containing protein [Salinibacterium sp. G-O1]